jgi:hypothetical protein
LHLISSVKEVLHFFLNKYPSFWAHTSPITRVTRPTLAFIPYLVTTGNQTRANIKPDKAVEKPCREPSTRNCSCLGHPHGKQYSFLTSQILQLTYVRVLELI